MIPTYNEIHCVGDRYWQNEWWLYGANNVPLLLVSINRLPQNQRFNSVHPQANQSLPTSLLSLASIHTFIVFFFLLFQKHCSRNMSHCKYSINSSVSNFQVVYFKLLFYWKISFFHNYEICNRGKYVIIYVKSKIIELMNYRSRRR